MPVEAELAASTGGAMSASPMAIRLDGVTKRYGT